MACGTPVVTSNTTSLPEVVGDAGLMVSPRDAEALAEALLRLLRDADLRAELRARGLQRARTFSWRASAERTLHVYEQPG
jgi:glycosyltransferase involved in cell wall biosynthesis